MNVDMSIHMINDIQSMNVSLMHGDVHVHHQADHVY